MNVRRLFPFALFTLLFATAIRPTIDPDLWWHLRTGEAVVDSGIPHTDIFSFTFPNNEWVTHEWLSDVVMWSLYQLGGLPLLQVVFAGLTVLIWLLVYRLCAGRPYIAGLVVAVAAKASEVVWGARPQLFNLLLFALFIYLLERRKDGALGSWVFLAFPLATVLWANLHSGYLLGIVVLATYLMGEWIENRRQSPSVRALSPPDVSRLAGATVASFLAALINPNGARLWIYPFETLGSSVQREFITEWFPPTPDLLIFWLTVALIVTGVFAMFRSRLAPTATELLMFAGTAVGAFLSVRNIPIFAVAAAPILARHLAAAISLDRFVDEDDAADESRLATAIGGAVIAFGALLIGFGTLQDNDEVVEGTFPVAAVDFIEASELSGPIFNAYNFGGYLIWRGIPVYIDGRADVYQDSGLLQYAKTAFVEEDWQAPLELYGIRLVLVERGSRLANALAESGGWELRFEDDVAVIYWRLL